VRCIYDVDCNCGHDDDDNEDYIFDADDDDECGAKDFPVMMMMYSRIAI